MTKKHARFVWKRMKTADRFKQRFRTSTWKITTRRSIIRHKDRIPHKQRISNKIRHISRSVTRSSHNARLHGSNLKGIAVFPEMIKLTAIRWEVLRKMKDVCKNLLDIRDPFSDRNPTTKFL